MLLWLLPWVLLWLLPWLLPWVELWLLARWAWRRWCRGCCVGVARWWWCCWWSQSRATSPAAWCRSRGGRRRRPHRHPGRRWSRARPRRCVRGGGSKELAASVSMVTRSDRANCRSAATDPALLGARSCSTWSGQWRADRQRWTPGGAESLRVIPVKVDAIAGTSGLPMAAKGTRCGQVVSSYERGLAVLVSIPQLTDMRRTCRYLAGLARGGRCGIIRYVKAMEAKVSADQSASHRATVGQALARMDAAQGKLIPGVSRLSSSLSTDCCGKVEKAVTGIGNALDRRLGLDRA